MGARALEERNDYLRSQLITYLGNKRALLDFIGRGVDEAEARLGLPRGGRRLKSLDVFSGSGVVSRYLKGRSSLLLASDLEPYARVISECYLTNGSDFPEREYADCAAALSERLSRGLERGFIAELYAPRDDRAIRRGERVFYTRRNAEFLDTARSAIEAFPERLKPYFIAPLLSEASIHANTSGVFKGFYKDRDSGLGRFGGRKGDALARIKGDIELRRPVLSAFDCECRIYGGDANELAPRLPEVDLAYLDPPYNQHPYGSNYFMLNLITEYRRPEAVSPVSGIPADWRRSAYNKARLAASAFDELVGRLEAKFVLVSFNSEGFISHGEMHGILGRYGKVSSIETDYSAFRGSRNLRSRELRVKEYLYLLEKR